MTAHIPPPVGSVTQSLRRRMARGGAVLLVARFVAQLVQWSVTLIVARFLAPEDYGLMAAGALFIGLADLLAEAGMGKALVHKKVINREDLAQVFTVGMLLAGGLYGAIFLLAVPAAGILARPEFTAFLRVLGLLLFLGPLRSVATALLERELHLAKQSVAMVAGAATQAGVVLGLAVAGFGFWALAVGALLSRCLETGLVWYTSGWRLGVARPTARVVGLLRYGAFISLSGVLWFVYSNADFAVLLSLLGPIALGYYSVAFQLISLPVQKLSANLNQVMFATFCRLQDEPDRARDWFLRLTALVSFLSMPLLTGLALVADDALPLVLGEQWRPSVVPFQLLCPVGAGMVVASGFPHLLNARGRPDVWVKFTGVCAVIFPIAFLVTGSRFGVLGVCATWLVLYPLLVALVIHLTRGITGISTRQIVRSQLCIIGGVLVMVSCVVVARWALTDVHPPLRLALSVLVGIVAYTTWMLRAARDTILADFRRVLGDLRGPVRTNNDETGTDRSEREPG